MSGKKYESNWQKKEQNTNEQTVKTRNENEHYERQKYTITTNQAMSGNQKVRNTEYNCNNERIGGKKHQNNRQKKNKVTTSKR